MKDLGVWLFMLAGVSAVTWGVSAWRKDMKELEAEWRLEEKGKTDYNNVSEREWAAYELDTIIYDYNILPEASERISKLLDRVLST